MHITLEADYSVRIVHTLARAGVRLDAQKISDTACVSLRFALKILHKLVGAGLVQSYKGIKGGYMLAKPPEDISLREVLEAVEGPYRINRCLGEEYDCTRVHGGYCPYHEVFNEISEGVREKLEEINFASFAQ